MQGSLFSSGSAKALLSRLADRGTGYRHCWSRHHRTEKNPRSCAGGVWQHPGCWWAKPELCSQTLLQASPDPSKPAIGNAVQCRPDWFCTSSVHLKFAVSTRALRSRIKMSSFLSSHNCSPEKAAQPAFSGLLLTPGADLVLTLPAANDNNSMLSHSAQYHALI